MRPFRSSSASARGTRCEISIRLQPRAFSPPVLLHFFSTLCKPALYRNPIHGSCDINCLSRTIPANKRIRLSGVHRIESSHNAMRIHHIVLMLAATLGLTSSAQTSLAPPVPIPTPKPLVFEVVTIKPDSVSRGWRLQPTPDGYTGTNISLYKLVQEAYGVYDSKLV